MMAKGPEQGDPRLLESDVARRLLASSIPARYAYTSPTGPRAWWRAGSTGQARSS
jgi:hypothetical protein